MIKVNMISLGCPKALVDTEKILGVLGASGIAISDSMTDSEFIIINTCAFIEPAIQETEAEIQMVAKWIKNTNKKLYVYGCAVNRFAERLKHKYPEVSAWFKLEEKKQLLKSINETAGEVESRLVSNRGYTYLKIADGCSNHCSYCTIPSIRGPYRSIEIEQLVLEANELAQLGIKELILIAQDTTAYGIDLYKKPMLVPLLKKLSKIPGIEWIRIMYAHPRTLSRELIDEIENNEKICKYLDLPIQHISDRLLKLMNRGVSRKTICDLIERLKSIKGMSLRTTVIAGFPTESEQEFTELVDFIKSIKFDWLGVFPYFQESGTQAATLRQLSDSEINRRFEQLLNLQRRLITEKCQHLIGTKQRTLFHRYEDKFIGHASFNAPEVDSHIIVADPRLELGKFYNIEITGVDGCDLNGILSINPVRTSQNLTVQQR